MLKITRWTVSHRLIVVAAWIAAAIGVLAVSSSIGSKSTNNFTLPGTGSQHAIDLLQSRFPGQAGDADQIVFRVRKGSLQSAGNRAAIAATVARVARLPHVVSVVSPYVAGAHSISRDGTVAFATVNFDERANVLPVPAIRRVVSTAQSANSAALQVELGGQAIGQTQQTSLGFALIVGIAAAILILLISFGSLTAMGLPLVTAMVGLAASVGLLSLVSHVLDMPDFASQLALMIGLGVGVDYALFIVTRFRENYRRNGGDVQLAIEAAMNTSGRAVVFAGMTVVIALLGMFALGVSLLSGAGVASAIAVVLVLAASLTLLPALLSVAGRRIGQPGRRARRRLSEPGPTFWERWVRGVQRRPALTAVAAGALMLALAAPALGLRLANSDAGNDPAKQTTHKAYELLAQGFGPGFNGPLEVAVALPSPHDQKPLGRLTRQLRATPGIASVAAPQQSPMGTAAVIAAYPTSSPQSAQTSNLVTRLRGGIIPPIERATGARIYIGGATASQADFSHVLSSKLPLFIAVVIALAALLLLVVFRSLAIPVQAAVMNLLSIGASLGIAQAVFERGWLGLFQSGPIAAFIPVLAFAIVFGLSMDYEVFLISRVHEEWRAGRDSSAAVAEGLARTGRVITAAAAVMVAVFAAFAISGDRILAMFGLTLASAVFLDAVVVRMLLLPAVLELLGPTTWALPHWIGRRIPQIAIEAERGLKQRPAVEPAYEPGS